LCNQAHFLPEELGAMCGLKHGQVKQMLKNNKFPLSVTLTLATFQQFLTVAQYKEKYGADKEIGFREEIVPIDLMPRRKQWVPLPET